MQGINAETLTGKQDYIDYFNYCLPLFKDERYILVDNKPIFGLYQPYSMPDIDDFIDLWHQLARENGFDGMYFIAFNSRCNGYSKFKTSKYDACIVDCVADSKYYGKSRFLNKCYYWLCRKLNFPEIVPYSNYVKTCIEFFKSHDDVIPCIVPNYDHTPRSKRAGMLLHKSTPEKWKSLLQSVKEIIDNKTIKSSNKNLIFIKAWNEWAEGNYLEPDCVYGRSYLEKIKEIFK